MWKRLSLAIFCFCFIGINPGDASAQKDSVLKINALAENKRLLEPGKVLQDFVDGKDTTRVIIQLSKPSELKKGGDIKDPAFRKTMRSVIKQTQAAVMERMDPSEATVKKSFSYVPGFAAEVTLDGLKALAEMDGVESVAIDEVYHVMLAQGIPLINATTVRETYNGSGVSIAICDSGIDVSHPMLGGTSTFPNDKVIGGYDTGDDDDDPRPDSTSGTAHGTSCAGIAAGSLGSEGDYIGGVAYDAKLYSVKVTYGTSGSAYTSDIIEGWEWCITHQYDDADNPILIISTSMGGGSYTSACDASQPALAAAADNAVAAGITLFVSSGNDGYCSAIAAPACVSSVNAVGAVYDATLGGYGWCVNSASCVASYTTGCSTSYYCADTSATDKVTCYSNSASMVSVLAPSNNTTTCDIAGSGGYVSGDYYTAFGGTSAASPYAAGAAACLQSAAKAITGSYLTPAEVKSTLTTTGDMITDDKATDVTKPRIDLGAAIDSLLSVVTIQATDPDAAEAGPDAGEMTVTRSDETAYALTVYYTVSGTATTGDDYQALSGSVVIASGESSATITITPIDDIVDEDNETVVVTLSTNATYSVGSPDSATVTIDNKEGDAYEVDDAAEQAKTITSGEPQSRSIHVVDDVDWATFTLAEASEITIQTDGEDGDTVLALYGPDSSTTLVTEDDDGNGYFSEITRTGADALPAGVYYVKVWEYGNDEAIDAYTLTFTAAAEESPMVTSIERTTPSGATTNASSVVYTVAFTESATGLSSSNFSLSSDGLSGASIESVEGSGAAWTVAVSTGTGDGWLELVMENSDSVVDSDSNALVNLPFSGEVYTIDKTAPTVAAGSDVTANASPTLTATASDDSTMTYAWTMASGPGAMDFGAPAALCTSATPDAEGSYTVRFTATDAAGNSAYDELALVWDVTSPGATISTTGKNPTNTSPIPVVVTFTEDVTGFTVSDVTVLNGTKSNFSGSGASYTLDVVPGANNSVTVSVAAGAAEDAAGNKSLSASALRVKYNATAPSVVLGSTATNPTNANPIPIVVTFSESVTGFDVGDVTVSNASKSDFSGSGATYSLNATPASEGAVTVSVASGVAKDSEGLYNIAADSLSRTYDATAPTVTLSVSSTEPFRSPNEKVSITFSEAVTGFTVDGVTPANGVLSDFTTVDSKNYTVKVTAETVGDVSLAVGASVTSDAAGNGNSASNVLEGTYYGLPLGVFYLLDDSEE